MHMNTRKPVCDTLVPMVYFALLIFYIKAKGNSVKRDKICKKDITQCNDNMRKVSLQPVKRLSHIMYICMCKNTPKHH